MQPVFTHDPLLESLWTASCLLWVVLEVSVEIRQRNRFRAGARRMDKGSKAVLGLLIRLGAGLCVLVGFTIPGAAIMSARLFLFWLGLLLFYVGIGLRFYAMRVLGAYFTTTLAIAPGQVVVESGPYRLIRHPSYSGLLLTLLGLGLSFTNWLSLLVLMGCALIGCGYRIHVEERVLRERLGLPYQEYMRRTKRLIPYIL
jgi:protein-S-isoprenylcysteine O-methyltransferase Ste14